MTIEQQAKELREALAAAERGGSGRPYPEALRRAAVEYRRAREHEGASLRSVATELGVNSASLLRWSRTPQQSSAPFRAIELVAPGQSDEIVMEPIGRTSRIVVVGPRGVRVEGLSVAELAELLARLS